MYFIIQTGYENRVSL